MNIQNIDFSKILLIALIFISINQTSFGNINSSANENAVTAEILQRLNDPNWEKRFEYLQKRQIAPAEYQKPQIKAALISLLEQAFEFRTKYINRKINEGLNRQQAVDQFYNENDKKGYGSYISLLTSFVFRYKDADTIPLIIKKDALLPSDEISLETYFAFGKEAFNKILIESYKGDEMEKVKCLLRLSGWVRRTLNNMIVPNLQLNSEELDRAQKRMFDGLKTSNGNELYYVNYGLFQFASIEKDINKKRLLKVAIKKSLNHKWGSLRKEAAEFLGEIGDSSDIQDLNKLLNDTEEDSFIAQERKKQIKATGKATLSRVYPVREAARLAIDKIKSREKLLKKK
jgi:hypothetical protein